MTITGHLVKPNGSHSDVDLDDTRMLDELNRVVECRIFDIVSLDHGIDVVVDDEGMLQPHPQLNLALTIIIHALGGRTAICGNGILVGSTDEGETVSLTDEQRAIINRVFDHGVDKEVTAAIHHTLSPVPHAIDLVRAAGF